MANQPLRGGANPVQADAANLCFGQPEPSVSLRFFRTIALLLVTLTGCATGRVVSLPSVAPNAAASLTVLRNRNFVGGCCAVKLSLDGVLIARLGSAEYLTVPVAPGSHNVSAHNASLALTYERDRAYYLLVTVLPGGGGYELEQIPDSTARRLMTTYRPLGR